jgi:hypothetical protein
MMIAITGHHSPAYATVKRDSVTGISIFLSAYRQSWEPIIEGSWRTSRESAGTPGGNNFLTYSGTAIAARWMCQF